MNLNDLLKLKRSAVLGRWQRMIAETYPADTARFMQERKDRFRNPVGHIIGEATPVLFDSLVAERLPEEIAGALDGIVRVRAVQEFSAAQAVTFVFQLKHAIREELGEEISARQLWTELSSVESSVDQMALTAFDVYMRCREQIYDVRARELRRRTSRMMDAVERVSAPRGDVTQGAGDGHRERT